MRPTASFFAQSLQASLPLWLWALHFSYCYVIVAVGCDAGWHRGTWAGSTPLAWLIAIGSAVAVVAAAVLLRQACRSAGRGTLFASVRALAASLALIGIVWASVPALLLPACHPA